MENQQLGNYETNSSNTVACINKSCATKFRPSTSGCSWHFKIVASCAATIQVLPDPTACNSTKFTAEGSRNTRLSYAVRVASITSKMIFCGFRYMFLLFIARSVLARCLFDMLLLCQKPKHGTLSTPFTRILIMGQRRELMFWSTIAVQSRCPIPFSRPVCNVVT